VDFVIIVRTVSKEFSSWPKSRKLPSIEDEVDDIRRMVRPTPPPPKSVSASSSISRKDGFFIIERRGSALLKADGGCFGSGCEDTVDGAGLSETVDTVDLLRRMGRGDRGCNTTMLDRLLESFSRLG